MADLGKNFRFPRGINKPMPGRDNFKNVTTVVEYCDLTLFAGLSHALLVNQTHGLLHHLADEHRVVGKHTREHLQAHTLTTHLTSSLDIQ